MSDQCLHCQATWDAYVAEQNSDRTRYESHAWDDEQCVACGVTWEDCEGDCDPSPAVVRGDRHQEREAR